jgi:glycosyltransferase involved in cell wall biosynthesis
MKPFSVITSVYKNDNPLFVKDALDSMLVNQSIKPTEIIMVRDGIVPNALENLLCQYESLYNDIVKVIRLKQNKGLGNALKIGVENAQYDLIARMDSDDICLRDRFEKQLNFFQNNPECNILGGQMTEFIGTPDNICGKRCVPISNDEIYSYMKNRCALNHVTVMFRKKTILSVGNYQDWFWNEDYYLWVRMMLANCKFANLPDVLVNVRSGLDQYSRRGGIKYFKSEIGIKRLMLKKGLISYPLYLKNYIMRFIVQILMPNKLRGWVFRNLARSK